MEEVLSACPTVCVVGNEYQIMIPVRKDTLLWVDVAGERFYDESNGILRSSCMVHRIAVPCEKLDRARGYTVCFRVIRERKAYFTDTEEEKQIHFDFRPVAADAGKIRIYHIADTHSWIDVPIQTASFWGDDLDLLVMNGDMMEDCSRLEYIAAPYQISGTVTKGEIPVLYSRGNHDLRGVLAEKYAEMTPAMNGNTYYSFRLGPLWGIILDCGEDKPDAHEAYGHTICCHSFRLQETEYLKKIAASPETEYAADGVRGRLVLCHLPFPAEQEPPFNIEEELYTQWCGILKEQIKPDLMLCGHIHRCFMIWPGGPLDHKGAPCPTVVGASMDREHQQYTGTAIEWTPEKADIYFTDQDHRILEHETVEF